MLKHLQTIVLRSGVATQATTVIKRDLSASFANTNLYSSQPAEAKKLLDTVERYAAVSGVDNAGAAAATIPYVG